MMSVLVSDVPRESELTEEEKKRFSMLFKACREDREWIDKHYNELKEKYPGRYIAVRHQVVVGVNKKRKQLIDRLKKEFGDIGGITIEYTGENPLKLLM
jgi:hypothetical protein